jgi:hypothetical protein
MAKKVSERAVIVRTSSAGVHFGYVAERRGKEIDLVRAKRIWNWQGANTLHEVANHGVGKGSRVSEAVAEITLTEAIEVIGCTSAAVENLEAATWL